MWITVNMPWDGVVYRSAKFLATHARPGMLIQLDDGSYRVIGHVNVEGYGSASDFLDDYDIPNASIVLRYKILWDGTSPGRR